MSLVFLSDGFRTVYCIIACFMWIMSLLFSIEYMKHHENKFRFYLFMILTWAATLGVFKAGDLYTLFIFFEIMSFTSFVWVAQEETSEALAAAKTYLVIAVIGGLTALMGIFMFYYMKTGVQIKNLQAFKYAMGICMLVGFGAKAGAFPLHIWLPKAHPVAPAPASALLSGILTKTGVFGVLMTTLLLFKNDAGWGNIILYVGTVTMLLGAFLALFSIDLKRTLACSSMSQIGFILVGIGTFCLLEEERELAAAGAFLHMINHSLIKLVLFMLAGAVYMKCHSLDLNTIQGYGRKKIFLKLLYLSGALTIMGIPGFGGYISKTLLHEALVESGKRGVEALFLLSGGMTIAYMTKLYVAIFIQKNKDASLQEKYDSMKSMNPLSAISLLLSAVVLLIFGRSFIMTRVSGYAGGFFETGLEGIGEIHFFNLENLKGAGISIIIGALIYCFIYFKNKDKYVNVWPKNLDLENLLYKPLLLVVLPTICGIICRLFDSFVDIIIVLLRKTVYKDSPLPHERVIGTVFTEAIGRFVNCWHRLRYRTLMWSGFDNIVKDKHRQRAGAKLNTDYVVVYGTIHENRKEELMIIERSLSFGLFMFCIGLTLTLIYLIFW